MRDQLLIRSTCLRVLFVAVLATWFAGASELRAQVLEHKRPTELLIKQYETFVAQGGLLTPEGWESATKFFAAVDPYPANSDIQIISAPGIIGEDHVNGDRAVVATKWGDYYGRIDSNLRFSSEIHHRVMLAEEFALVFVPRRDRKGITKAGIASGEWKIERTPKIRAASVPEALKYVARMREKSKDPIVRKNATSTMNTLKHMSAACGIPNPC